MTAWTAALPYFPEHELRDSHDGTIRLDVRFAAALPELRFAWGRPLYPTSICRTPNTNAAVGGHPRSLHLTDNPLHPTEGTMAGDLYWEDWALDQQERFYHLAWDRGWSCGLHPTFVHVDLRVAIGLEQRTFHYPAWDGRFANV
jgi:hypothetical protein